MPITDSEGLQVIGAGFGRTGTASLKLALEQLGFGPCYHMFEVFENPSHAGLWEQGARGKQLDWDVLFAGYRSTVDWPAATFYDQLAVHYPDAKVLLSVRDPQRWYDSVHTTIYGIRQAAVGSPLRVAAFRVAGLVAPRYRRIPRMSDALIWDGTFQGRFSDREYAIAVFEEHNVEVQRRIPAGRLLVYDVKEGWAPLCAFLGVDVPATPFPHVNAGDEFRRRMGRTLAVATAAPLVLAAVAVAAALGWRSRS